MLCEDTEDKASGAADWVVGPPANFCPAYGTLGHLNVLVRVLEGAWQFAQPGYVCFLHMEKSYDHVPLGVLVRLFWKYDADGCVQS